MFILKKEDVPVPPMYTRSSDGWLMVKLEPSGKMVFLPDYTKIVKQKEVQGRVHFLITEGVYRNQTASLKKENADKYLFVGNRGIGATITVIKKARKPTASNIRFEQDKGKKWNQLWATLKYNGKEVEITLDSEVEFIETDKTSPNFNKKILSSPLPNGTYNILTPTYPHDASMTAWYRTHANGHKNLKYDTVWFPIEDAASRNSKMVHVGHLSEGCVTIYTLSAWNDLYQYLIANRLDKDGKYVGKLIIR